MNEEYLKIFIKGASGYFSDVASKPAEINPPYLQDEGEITISDYSAIIGISGAYKGCIYYTAPQRLLMKLIESYGEVDGDEAILCDAVGEITNTISGNAQKDLGGANFMISVPFVFRGKPQGVHFPKDTPIFVIPIVWCGFISYLLICIKFQ